MISKQCGVNHTCIVSLHSFFCILELKNNATVRFWELKEGGTLLQRAGQR